MELFAWREKLAPYDLAVQELVVKFQHMITDYRAVGQYSPIEQVKGRVKTISSILDKANRKGVELEDIEERIDDIAGIRLICQFEADIYEVAKLIRHMSDLEIVSEKDYIHVPKSSGYRSYHINVLYDVETIYGHKRVKVEIQIRTLAMNFWSIIEHSLHYKYNGNIPPEIEDRLLNSARAVQALDYEMASIREVIISSQNQFQNESGTVADIVNNLQNLYKVSEKEEMLKLQREFYTLYRKDDKEELLVFSRRIDELAASRGIQRLRYN